MFSLIITIISIALVAALAVATIYYGGTQFNRGSDKARAATMLNHAQQIAGANSLYKVDNGSHATVVSDLVPGYLSSAPVSPFGAYTLDAAGNNVVTATGVSSAVCTELNNQVAGSCTAGTFTFQG